MNLDWKEISQSEGYRKLKAAYIRDVQECNETVQRGHRPMRDKQEFLNRFKWAISRAIHYAHHQSRSVGEVLTEWETKRRSWWFGYYQECSQKWLVKSPTIKCKTLKSQLKQDLHQIRNAPNKARRISEIRKHYFNFLLRLDANKSKRKGDKRRWSKSHREYIQHKKEWSKRK